MADDTTTVETTSNEDTFELLNTDEQPEVLDLPKKDPGEEVDEEKEDEEKDELKEIEEELEDDDKKEEEINDELVTPVKRKEILAKYPKLFKDFPYLEKAYYREQQFTEVFPTIQDARQSAEKAQILDNTEQQLMSGDITNVLAAVKQEDSNTFYKIVDNYLPTLKRVDQGAYYHVLGNVIKDTIITMVKEGRALGEQGAPLQAAANVLNQFVFGSQNFTPPQNLGQYARPEEVNRQQMIQQQEQERFYGTFESVKEGLQTKADNVLKSTIDGHIDPNGTMSDYVKSHATKEAFDNLETLISKDARFRSLLDKLWVKAFQTNFDRDTTDKIKSAYLSKAKTLLPSVIKKARSDALRGRASNFGEDRPERKEPITSGRSTSPTNSGKTKYRKPSDIPRGVSTLDVLMGK